MPLNSSLSQLTKHKCLRRQPLWRPQWCSLPQVDVLCSRTNFPLLSLKKKHWFYDRRILLMQKNKETERHVCGMLYGIQKTLIPSPEEMLIGSRPWYCKKPQLIGFPPSPIPALSFPILPFQQSFRLAINTAHDQHRLQIMISIPFT